MYNINSYVTPLTTHRKQQTVVLNLLRVSLNFKSNLDFHNKPTAKTEDKIFDYSTQPKTPTFTVKKNKKAKVKPLNLADKFSKHSSKEIPNNKTMISDFSKPLNTSKQKTPENIKKHT